MLKKETKEQTKSLQIHSPKDLQDKYDPKIGCSGYMLMRFTIGRIFARSSLPVEFDCESIRVCINESRGKPIDNKRFRRMPIIAQHQRAVLFCEDAKVNF